jgi:hypothetical protein
MLTEQMSAQIAGSSTARQVSRRRFFQLLRAGYQVHYGKPAYRLSMLEDLPDQTLGKLVPAIVADWDLVEQDGFLWGISGRSEQPIKLLAVNTPAYSCLNLFGCKNSLERIGSQVAQEMGWDSAQGFAFVREFFLTLVKLGICVPE